MLHNVSPYCYTYLYLNLSFRFGQPGVDLHCHHGNEVSVLQVIFLVNEVRTILVYCTFLTKTFDFLLEACGNQCAVIVKLAFYGDHYLVLVFLFMSFHSYTMYWCLCNVTIKRMYLAHSWYNIKCHIIISKYLDIYTILGNFLFLERLVLNIRKYWFVYWQAI